LVLAFHFLIYIVVWADTATNTQAAQSLARCTQGIDSIKFITDMSSCKYCGQNAGLFKSVHKECVTAYETGKVSIVDMIGLAICEGADFKTLEAEVSKVAAKSYIKPDELSELYCLGFDKSIESFLEDGVVTVEEEQKIENFKNHFTFPDDVLDKRGSLQRLVKSLILRDIFENKMPSRLNISGDLPFLLQKDENVIWLFQGVECYEQRTKTTYEGRSQGVSVRIAKGLYYRTGSFKGNPVMSEHAVLLGTGIIALTNKNLYFGSDSKTFKTPYNKLISITPYSDGIGMQKDGVSAKPQIFKPLDGWFAYNLISNLSSL